MEERRQDYARITDALTQAQIDVALLKSELGHLNSALDDLRISNAAQTVQLRAIQEMLSEAKGSWRLLMLMGGAGATFGGLITWFGQYFTWKG